MKVTLRVGVSVTVRVRVSVTVRVGVRVRVGVYDTLHRTRMSHVPPYRWLSFAASPCGPAALPSVLMCTISRVTHCIKYMTSRKSHIYHIYMYTVCT